MTFIQLSDVDALVQVGKSIIPIVHPHLNSPNPQLRRMATVILSRVDPREFGALVGTHVTSNLLTIYGNCGHLNALASCADIASISILQDTLEERNHGLIDEIFYLLAAIHPPATVKIITESLHSQDPRVRANATEALEALTTPQTAQLIAPLFEPGLPLAGLLRLSQDTWDMERPDTVTTIRQLVAHPDDSWLRTISTFALGEIGASHATGKRPDRRSPPADLFAALADGPVEPPAPSSCLPLILPEIEMMLQARLTDPVEQVQVAAQAAQRMIAGLNVADASREEETLLSTIERIIFLKEVSFFEGMTIDQLHALANVCEEEFFAEDAWIFEQKEPGGTLYVVVSGRVAIEREGRRKGSFVRLATIEAHSYFGEMSLFDQGPRSAAARAIQDTLLLRLRREPLLALVRQHPNLSLELIHVLSQRLRESNDRIAQLTRSMPRELHKLYDKLD